MHKPALKHTFRASGIIAGGSLVALVAYPFSGPVAIVLWIASGASLLLCLYSAWLLRDGAKGATIFEALWLRGSEGRNRPGRVEGHRHDSGGGDDGD